MKHWARTYVWALGWAVRAPAIAPATAFAGVVKKGQQLRHAWLSSGGWCVCVLGQTAGEPKEILDLKLGLRGIHWCDWGGGEGLMLAACTAEEVGRGHCELGLGLEHSFNCHAHTGKSFFCQPATVYTTAPLGDVGRNADCWP